MTPEPSVGSGSVEPEDDERGAELVSLAQARRRRARGVSAATGPTPAQGSVDADKGGEGATRARREPARPEPARTVPARTEPARTEPALVGREAELGALESLLRRLNDGWGGIAVLEGPGGIGKSRLAADAARLASENGIAVLHGRADELDQGRAFGPLLDAFECRRSSADPRRAEIARLASAPGPTADPYRLSGDSVGRYPAQEALIELALDRFESAAHVLVLDDLQWADAGTLAVIGALARRTERLPLVILATARTQPRNAGLDRLIDRLGDQLVSVPLRPLAAEAVGDLVASIVGARPGRRLLDRVARAEGNPFFVLSVLEHLSGSSSIRQRGHVADLVPGDEPGPPTGGGYESILARVRRLPEGTVEVLQLAAVLGPSFAPEEVALLLGKPTPTITSLLMRAVNDGLLDGDGPALQFQHDLVREAIYAELPRSIREALHRDVARVLTVQGADPEVIASHLARGARAGDHEAVRRILEGADIVVRHDASRAASLLERAVALSTPLTTEWLSAVSSSVAALQWAGRVDEAERVVREALAHRLAPDQEAVLRIRLGHCLGMRDDLAGATAEMRAVLDLPTLPIALRAELWSELATLTHWGMAGATAMDEADTALRLANECGATKIAAQALCIKSIASSFAGDIAAGVELAREAQRRVVGLDVLTPAVELYLGMALLAADEAAEALHWLHTGQRKCERHSDMWLVARYQAATTLAHLLAARYEEARADAEAIISMSADTGIRNGVVQAWSIIGLVSFHGGDLEAARTACARAEAEMATASGEAAGMLFYGWLHALLAERDGRVAEAWRTIEAIFAAARGAAEIVISWLGVDAARIGLAAGHGDAVDRLVADLHRLAERAGVPSIKGLAALCGTIAASGPGHEPDASLVEAPSEGDAGIAVAALRSAGRPRELAIALDLHSLQLAMIGRGKEALAAHAEARQVAQRSGALLLASEIVAGFAQRSRGVGRMAAGNPPIDSPAAVSPQAVRFPELTPTQAEIVELVVDGQSNAAIADHLGISKRTVEWYVSNAYVRLDVPNRVALAALGRSRRAAAP